MKIQTFTIVAGTKACNAKCPYCVSKMTPSQGLDLEPAKVNWLNFEKACRLSQINNVSTVLITGKGEPLLFPEQITKFLEQMKSFNFPLIEIQTNALSFGYDFKKCLPYLKKWRKLGLSTIAISIVHYKKEKNKEIFTPNSDYIDLGNVISNLHGLGYSVRLSCIMLKGFIDSVDGLKELIEFSKKNKVEQLTARSVIAPDKSENKDVWDYASKHALSRGQILDITEYFEKNATKLMTLDHGGLVYDYEGQNICLTDCLTIKSSSEELRQLIFFPDGHLRYDWRFPGATLL